MLYLDYKRNKVLENINESRVRVSTNIADRNTHFLRLSEEQEEYYNQYPNASARQIWEMTTVEPTTEIVIEPSKRRQMEYLKQIPKSMIDAYTTYTIEGNTDKAAEIAAEIIQIKNEIREMYPDEVG